MSLLKHLFPTHAGSESADRYLVDRVATTARQDTVEAVLNKLPGKTFDSIDAIYILDETGHLEGVVRLGDLFSFPSTATMGEIMTRQFPVAHTTDDREHVAGLSVRSKLAAIPVVDRDDRFLGVVPAEEIVAILRHEHIEDLHRLAGIQRETDRSLHALEDPPVRRARARLPWLLVGLAGSIVATFVMTQFEQILSSQVKVSFFVPGIIYLADAIGTQTEAIAVRGLSFNHNSLKQLLAGELVTGMLIGLCLGILSFPLVLLGFGDFRLAWAVALAILTAGTMATSVGLFFPWCLHQIGQDPAFGSGPVATIIQDVVSLLVYFVIVQWLIV
jgi:magnesium transporter